IKDYHCCQLRRAEGEDIKRPCEVEISSGGQFRKMVSFGFYKKFLSYWLDALPRKQLLVCEFEELKQDPLGMMRKIEQFLNLPQYDGYKLEPKNVTPYRVSQRARPETMQL